ncbi:MAG TPA: glycosyl hydrolase [Bacteroidales bacterium]|nr:glycosyl hydrolase [Bacteroidales bacterium]HPT21641.1 glycosyl hydrolase [Bacteroidales bacterium]
MKNILIKPGRRINVLFQVSLFLSLSLFFISCASENTGAPTFTQIEAGFKNIPDSIRTGVYWYWISDNISKEGVVKDLQAMKKVGINRAFIGNIGLEGSQYGKVKILSDEWWDILHTALKTATELNIEIGIFNSPGWSQSGGPWVKNKQSMRYLNSSETRVTGPIQYSSKLASPAEDFELLNVIAYRLPVQSGKDYRSLKPRITSHSEIKNISYISDGDCKTEVPVQKDKILAVGFQTNDEATVRSLIIKTSQKPIIAKGELFAIEDNIPRSLKSFEINRSNSNINVGFDPFPPVVLSIPETRSKNFRLVINDVTREGGIAEVELSPVPKLERYPEKSLAKMFQTPLPYWKDYLWPEQPEVDKSLIIDPAGVIDITKNLAADGTLNWEVPEGEWIIMQNGMTSTGQKNSPASPEGTGLETDKMNRKHVEAHFDAFMGEILRRIPEADRRTWKIVVEDSYETGSQNWTDNFTEEFTAKYGYSPVPYIPVLRGNVVGSRNLSDRFLWDLRRLVADKVSYDYVGGLREVSNINGLTTWLENYGHWGFPGEFLQYGGQSDEVAGEFWSEGDLGNIENRAASSCAHIYGKNKVSAESFTCAGRPFSRYPAVMKQRGDRFFTEGINNTLMHVYIQQPDERVPGANAWFGNEFNRHNTWFSQMDVFIQYLKRCNFMLQQGRYIADVAYFIGEDAPKMTGICDPALPQGYSFDYINGEVINTRTSVKDGKIMLPDGMSYRLLVLPKLKTMRPELLKKIKELVEQGAVVLGPAPEYSPSLQNYPQADQQVKQTVSELWGDVDGINVKSRKVGRGMILSGMAMQEALDFIKVIPDCRFGEEDPALFIHRKTEEGDIYFISNQSDKTIKIAPELRTEGKSPELWDATSGTIRDLPAYTFGKGMTTVPLKLEAFESAFIIFRDKSSKSGEKLLSANFPEHGTLTEVNGPWIVTFDKNSRGPVNPVTFESLQDWTASTNDSIKYYSGTAVYKTTFSCEKTDADGRFLISLGDVKSIARVNLNGKELGGVWTAPWSLDISSVLKRGENILEVEVANTWANRLTGESRLAPEKRWTWCTVNSFKPDNTLESSGLIGPVKIQQVKY